MKPILPPPERWGLGHCRWWALCENEAVRMRHHPILGNVAICERCDSKLEALTSDGDVHRRPPPGMSTL